MQINTTSKSTIINSLDSIANDLILNKAIRINDSIYALIDIELYYWHENHPDDYARGVNHNKPKSELEAHRYGIDLSLGNKMESEFGGILICGLYDLQQNTVIEKSHVLRTLFNQLSLGNNNIEIIPNRNNWAATFKSKRMNLGVANNQNKKNFEKYRYKYLAKESAIFKNYKGKETIFRESDLSEFEITEILGYKLKR